MRKYFKKIDFVGNSRIPSKFLVFKTQSAIEPLLWETCSVPNCPDAIQLDNDIALLFNQNRLNLLGTDGAKAFLAELDKNMSSSPALSSLRQKVSDDDLLKFCKSRYVQSPSEMMAWLDYLSANYEKLSDDVAKAVAKAIVEDEQNKKPVETVTPVETPKTE